ncbi:MAG: FecR domain-containing protein [Terriglobales bacterium]
MANETNLEKLRRAAEAWLPEDGSLSATEVSELLQTAGVAPEALEARFAAQVPLESCAAFQALLPSYRAGNLPQARKLLLEDHLRHCVACRHALHPDAAKAAPTARVAAARHSRVPQWAYWAAAAVIVIAVASWAGRAGLLPGQSQAVATLEQSSAGAYAITGSQVRPVATGYVLRSGDELRSGAGAEIVLRHGTAIEMGSRTALLVAKGWSGTTVHLLHGEMIVRAAAQGWGRQLHVATADSRITDQGTVFAVAHGLMGSRVAVAEGRVAFEYSSHGQTHTETLLAGEEATSNERLALVPMRQEFNWSRNAGQYLAMLDELSTMGKQLEALAPAAPRFNSQLLSMVPANAALYAAIPNLNQALTETQQILNSDLGSSPALESWWNQPGKNGGPTHGQALENTLNRVQQVTGYLGNEIALAASGGAGHGFVVLAAVTKPGLAAAISSLSSGQNGHGAQVRILTNPADAGTGTSKALLIWIGNNRLVATDNGALLQECAALAQRSGPGPFLQSQLYQKVAPLYQAGASWILAANLNHLHTSHVPSGVSESNAGASHPEFLVARSQLLGNGTPSEVEVDFSGARSGLAGILSEPGPMAGLQFISPQASLVTSVLTVNPAQMQALLGGHSHHAGKPETPQEQAVSADLTNLFHTLGGEFTFAQDGPVLPKPAWKAIVEVNDTLAAQNAIAQLITDGNALAKHPFALSKQTSGGQTIYTVGRGAQALFTYTYAGSYLVAGSNATEVEDALQTYQSGTGLPFSTQFQEQLPQNGHTNFSALLYHNLGANVASLSQTLLPSISAEWQPEVKALLSSATPGLTYAYATPDSIQVASTRGLLGLTIQDVLALQLHAGSKHQKRSR